MSSNEKGTNNLREAMHITMDFSQSFRVWKVPELELKIENLPENATIENALIMLTSASKWHLGVEWTIEGHTGYYFGSLLECSSLQELLDKLPEEHFYLKGDLSAFEK